MLLELKMIIDQDSQTEKLIDINDGEDDIAVNSVRLADQIAQMHDIEDAILNQNLSE